MNILMVAREMPITIIIVKNILVLVLMCVYAYYIYLYHNNLVFNKLLFLIMTNTSMLILVLYLSDKHMLYMPMLIAVMLIAIIIDQRLAIMTHLVNVCIVGIIGQQELIFFVYYIIVGVLTALIIVKAKERTKIFYIAIIISGFSAIFYNIVSYALKIDFSALDTLLAALNGIITVILVVGSLPLWETIFQVVTPLKLLELVNSDNILLQRLLAEAPGSYHHSRMVSNLSERAASMVGADPLLARTGALYHDIGKLKEPMYFIENQDGKHNPHDDISAEASAEIIIEHVHYGVKLAKENKLPKTIVDIVQQHHGTSLVSYFYHKAQEYDDGIDYDAKQFRYAGPRPQSKEAAIVMFADCVEAYVRSLEESQRTLERIKEIITEIMNQKYMEHQLDECDLQLKSIPIIAEAFAQVYNGMYHERVKYPTNR